MTENEISKQIIGTAINLHKNLGPGLLMNFNTRLLKDGVYRIVNNL